jgi:hypothetical protein
MKTIAAIKNELFQDYLKVVSTDNLEQTLDNPNVPVPFVCVAAVQNPNSDKLAAEINKFFEHKKLKNKDFLAMNSDDITQLHFLFNLVQLSTTGESTAVTTPVATAPVAEAVVEKAVEVAAVVEAAPVVEKAVEAKPAKVKEAPIAEPVVETVAEEAPVVEEKVEVVVEVEPEVQVESTPAVEVAAETVVEVASVAETVEEVAVSSEGAELIEALGIPKNSTIHFAKNAEVTATIVDEKTVVFDGEELPIVDATKKAFKKAGTTGMALGLANWNYEGTSLKALKDKN